MYTPMYTAFCCRPGCDWEAAQLYSDPLRALARVDAHLFEDHGRRPADPIPTEFPDMIAVPFRDVAHDIPRSYVMATDLEPVRVA